MKKLIYIVLFLFVALQVSAQNAKVNASIDTNQLLLGEQTQIHLKLQYQLDGKPVAVQFPDLLDTLNKFVEVVYSSKIDTGYPNKDDLSLVEQTQTITITSFDSGYYKIPYFNFKLDETTLTTTEELFIDVQPMLVDTTKAIFDIKAPIEEPFSFTDWLKENWVWLATGLAIIILIIVLIKYLKSRPKTVVEEIIPTIPDYTTAIERLNELREKQLWQNNKVKAYHSELSEIIRAYLESRFNITALENTTDEIMRSLRFETIPPATLSQLNQVLMLSDLVKFAKEQPIASENELSFSNAMEIVLATKLIITPTEEKEEDAE